jgi:hypothetical protein
MFRRVRNAGFSVSMQRILKELDAIREVVNIYPKKRGQNKQRMQAVLSKRSELQEEMMSILQLKQEENTALG